MLAWVMNLPEGCRIVTLADDLGYNYGQFDVREIKWLQVHLNKY
jgi:hypothetical protein